MAEGPPLTDLVQRAIEANVRYYDALGRITRDYWQAVFAMVRDAPSLVNQLRKSATEGSPSPSARDTPTTSTASLVLEGTPGAEPSAVFMVNNHLRKTVAAPVMISPFVNASGRVIRPPIRLAPAVVTLEPGGHALVQVSVIITDELEPEVAYRGDVSVPALSDHRIPVLIRRHADESQGSRKEAGGSAPNEASGSTASRRRGGRTRRSKKV